MTDTVSTRIVVGVCLLFFFLGIGIGAYSMHKWGPKETVTVTESASNGITEPIVVKTETDSTAKVAVVPIIEQGDMVQFREQTGRIIAIVNGKEYDVPNMTNSAKVELGTSGQLEIQHQTTGQLDVTPIVNQLLELKLYEEKAKWSKDIKHNAVSIGLGYHDEWYIPLEYQFDYAKNRAIGFEVHKDLGRNLKSNGGEVKHVWKF
ncbi:MAG: hypothetical protein H6Q73_653 [Firmicutes bacterium]|nr:hypothetical protein [Bacillota bacterium]